MTGPQRSMGKPDDIIDKTRMKLDGHEPATSGSNEPLIEKADVLLSMSRSSFWLRMRLGTCNAPASDDPLWTKARGAAAGVSEHGRNAWRLVPSQTCSLSYALSLRAM
ncbi:hypothetical protein DOTSEDRAFT_70977 [Dothistroma septosporum NZE10]|uniref:Uncharacterized protein n=1 Tax=Dothistroma septosporum (strain NZE10 / CBS 128990) TaxID=675120 RepID=N1PQA5_DOTSN|nr:hypothetical protein DOTSEDRAFT_70977 [Dothistroma septosporum NZE10]